MPVTIYPSKKPLAKIPWTWEHLRIKESRHLLCRREPEGIDSQKLDNINKRLLYNTLNKKHGYDEVIETTCGNIIQSSIGNISRNERDWVESGNGIDAIISHQSRGLVDLDEDFILPANHKNGLVGTVLFAYNNHHHLILRPDDVWICILSQFCLYMNANAEQMRHRFVAHGSAQNLDVEFTAGTRYTVNFSYIAEKITSLLNERIRTPELRDWMLPNFTTTTETDKSISSIIMMSTLKHYFKYRVALLCGLPAVTLLGEQSDWEALEAKIDGLLKYAPELERWHSLLKPVVKRFIGSFTDPLSDSTLGFWNRITHHQPEGSHSTYLSGWITAFCFFDREGGLLFSESAPLDSPLDFLELDGVRYHQVEIRQVPPSYASVPVTISDNGKRFETYMVAGSVGVAVSDSGMVQDGHDGLFDTVQPVGAWWLFESTEEE